MNLTLKRDPVWLSPLLSPGTSSTIFLLSGDGQQVAVHAPLLLAVSPLVRSSLTNLLPPAYSPCFLSLPDVTEEVLHVMVDILTTGTSGGEHMDKIEDVRQVFEILCVDVSLASCNLDSIQVGEVRDMDSKEENSSDEGPDKENIKIEVIVKSEDKISADVEMEVTRIKYILKEVEFPCNLCRQKFKHEQHLVRHIRTVHDQIKIPCNLCPQKLKQKQNLTVHEEVKIPCSLCPQKFTLKRNLSRHIRRVHDEMKIPCNLCTQKFTQKQNLVMHIKTVHDKIKISCNLCPLKFTQKQHLERHIRNVHNLSRHIRRVHDEMKIPCNLCPQKFTLKQNLVMHIKTIHDKIKISCNLCPLKFTQKHHLERHIRNVHN